MMPGQNLPRSADDDPPAAPVRRSLRNLFTGGRKRPPEPEPSPRGERADGPRRRPRVPGADPVEAGDRAYLDALKEPDSAEEPPRRTRRP